MPAEQAQVSVFDSGFMQGIGLFETMRAFGGEVFRLDRHLDRLASSARTLGWTIVPDVDRMRDNVEQVVRASEPADLRVRLTVTTGTLRATEQDTPQLTVVATASPGAAYPPELYAQGVTVLVSEYRQNRQDPTAGHKTTSYFTRLAALRQAHARQAFETLWFTHENRLAEGAISSVFVVQDDELLTPPLETPVLPGITRASVIELAAELKIAVREEELIINDVLSADEMFLTNSLMGIMPVVRIEREPVGTERPGELTHQLAEAYVALVERECAHA
jgi:branched-subunit amino acid aminotransferase/4-amino-4-deoxychorismate lyase